MEPSHSEEILEKQAARAFLREQFLWTLTSLVGHEVNFSLHENTNVTAVFRACDVDILHFCVSNLTTALGAQPDAILRSSDVVSFTVDLSYLNKS